MRRHIRRFQEQSAQQEERNELAEIIDAGDITVSVSQVKSEDSTTSGEENVSELYHVSFYC